MKASVAEILSAIAGLISVRSLLVLGGGGVAAWLAIDGTLDAQSFLTAISTLSGAYIGGRFAQGNNG